MIVLITGASSGFGEEMARKFVRNGHMVIAAARRSEKLSTLQAELGASLLPVTIDVTDRASIKEALAALPEKWKEIDVLINNAGLALGIEPAHQAILDEWETMHFCPAWSHAKTVSLLILDRLPAQRLTRAGMFMGRRKRSSRSSPKTFVLTW